MVKLNGYTYSAMKGVGPKIRWRCSAHSQWGCHAMLHSMDDKIVYAKQTHTHKPVFP